MEQAELRRLPSELIAAWENGVVEFTQASNDYKTDTIGEYCSAPSTEANLRAEGRIHNTGTRGQPIWKLAENLRPARPMSTDDQ